MVLRHAKFVEALDKASMFMKDTFIWKHMGCTEEKFHSAIFVLGTPNTQVSEAHTTDCNECRAHFALISMVNEFVPLAFRDALAFLYSTVMGHKNQLVNP